MYDPFPAEMSKVAYVDGFCGKESLGNHESHGQDPLQGECRVLVKGLLGFLICEEI